MSTTPPPPPPPPRGDDDRWASPAPDAPSGPVDPPFGTDAGHGGRGDEAWPQDPATFGHGPDGRHRNTPAVTALVLGLIAFPGVFVLVFIPVVGLLTVVTPLVAIAAIVLGVIGIRRARRPEINGGVGMGVAGLVLGTINLLLVAALVVFVVTFARACPDVFDATSPEEMTEATLACFEEQGFLEPGEVDELEQQLDEQLDEDADDAFGP